ncbi:MAG: GNAT family N-acetyltransferase [Nostocaceae cyanobacterium]|nr:GNAT family N-acetyltransferase [Nostocaceae cyanobacterium]
MNIYSDDTFCEAFGVAYFPNHKIQPQLFELDGRLWKIPTINSTKPILTGQFIDFYESYEQQLISPQDRIKKLNYIPKACHGLVSSNEWFDQNLEDIYEPAPTIIWEDFTSWDDFVEYVQQNQPKIFADSRRRRRKLEKEVGPVKFIFDDNRPHILDTCLAWKSQQYRNSGLIDAFAYQEHVRLFQELANKGLLLVSSLSAGEKPIAVDLSASLKGRLYSWIPAYDISYRNCSPGRLIMEFVLQESFKRKYEEFDFMIGNESYKWYYATHTRLISEMGVVPVPLRLKRSTKAIVKPIISSAVRPFPGFQKSLKHIQKQVEAKLYRVTK